MLPVDRILMDGMGFFGRHGVFPAERELGARFSVDVELEGDLRAAGASDRLEDTIDYALAYDLVRQVVEGEPCHLLEAVAERIVGGRAFTGLFRRAARDVHRAVATHRVAGDRPPCASGHGRQHAVDHFLHLKDIALVASSAEVAPAIRPSRPSQRSLVPPSTPTWRVHEPS